MITKNNIDELIKDLNNSGIAKSNLKYLLNKEEYKNFERTLDFYKSYKKDPHIKNRIENIQKGLPDKNYLKWYEINAHEFLKRPMTLGDPVFDLYINKKFIEIASSFYETNEIRLRSIQSWIHPNSPLKKEINSQQWHRDQEDFKILKIFILVNDIDEQNGPTEYIKGTQHGGIDQDITYNMTWLDYKLKPTLFKKIKNAYVKRFARYKFKFTPKIDNYVKATGKKGDIFFINSNGLHKGGQVKKDERLLLHGTFLRKDAPKIKYDKHISFNSEYNFIDYTSEAFCKLDQQQQNILR